MGNSIYAIYETPIGRIGVFLPSGFLYSSDFKELKETFIDKMTEIDEDLSVLDDECFRDWVFTVTNPGLDRENTPRISSLNFKDAAYVYNMCKVLSHNDDCANGLTIYYLHKALKSYFITVQGTYDESFPDLDLEL